VEDGLRHCAGVDWATMALRRPLSTCWRDRSSISGRIPAPPAAPLLRGSLVALPGSVVAVGVGLLHHAYEERPMIPRSLEGGRLCAKGLAVHVKRPELQVGVDVLLQAQAVGVAVDVEEVAGVIAAMAPAHVGSLRAEVGAVGVDGEDGGVEAAGHAVGEQPVPGVAELGEVAGVEAVLVDAVAIGKTASVALAEDLIAVEDQNNFSRPLHVRDFVGDEQRRAGEGKIFVIQIGHQARVAGIVQEGKQAIVGRAVLVVGRGWTDEHIEHIRGGL
jgi:hypothetical protein